MLRRLRLFGCLALGLLLLAVQHTSSQKVADLEGLIQEEDKLFIEHEGVRWQVLEDPEQEKAWFWNSANEEATWDDPRGGARLPLNVELPLPTVQKGSKLTTYMVAVIPVILLCIALAARIYYLHVYYPELLWPTKERKNRRRNNQKFRPQKARGKMNQDGKGGRSANS